MHEMYYKQVKIQDSRVNPSMSPARVAYDLDTHLQGRHVCPSDWGHITMTLCHLQDRTCALVCRGLCEVISGWCGGQLSRWEVISGMTLRSPHQMSTGYGIMVWIFATNVVNSMPENLECSGMLFTTLVARATDEVIIVTIYWSIFIHLETSRS